MNTTLLILAAGMGSRYGGLKQIDAFGPNGETILDYSIYDAINAGFTKIVFVIRESFEQEFREFFSGKFDHLVEVEYSCQEIYMVPEGASYNEERKKPWGTAHAILVAKDVINEPFAVINADDYYGKDSFHVLKNFFKANYYESNEQYGLVGYKLANTLSEHGTVNRGVCGVDKSGNLIGINERLKIGYDSKGNISYPSESGGVVLLRPDTLVSMNMWAFYPSYFKYCEDLFRDFLNEHKDNLKAEFFIPLLIDHLITQKKESVKVLSCDDEWFGVTYQEDKPVVIEKLNQLIDQGKYPKSLWPKSKNMAKS